MFIRSVETPNPETMMFYPGASVMGEEKPQEFSDVESAVASPLTQELLMIEGSVSVMYGSDFISVTKAQHTDWNTLKPQIILAILNHYDQEDGYHSIFPELAGKAAKDSSAFDIDFSQYSEEDRIIVEKIIGVLECYVVPRLAQDGGYVEFCRYEEGSVYLKMRGACTSCPSAAMTLQHGIRGILSSYIPEVQDVINVDEEVTS